MENSEEEFDKEIDRIVALQDFDRSLKERVDNVDRLTGEADEHQGQLDIQRKIVTDLTTHRENLKKEKVDFEEKLEIDGGKMRDNRMRMSRVRNDRELLALQKEIDLSRESKAQLEEGLLLAMETLEATGNQLTEEQAKLEELEQELLGQIEQRRVEAAELSEGLDDEKARREKMATGIGGPLRSKYEQLFSARSGTAVVEARGGVCTGCHMNVPPQLFNELQRYREVRQCPSCHRIIFYREHPSEE